MMDWKWNEEVQRLSHVALVVAVEAFSLFLIVLNRILGWEVWTIPIVIVASVTCFVMHVGRLSPMRSRLAIYSIVLLMEMFFYSVKVETIYDSTPVIAILLVLFAMAGSRALIYSCIAVGYFGMIFHILSHTNMLTFDAAHIVRTVWHFVLVLVAGIATERLMDAWGKMDAAYREQLDTLGEENNRINTFLVNVSHEIRTPVNAVVGLSAVMLKRERDDAVRRDMLSVRDAGRRVAEQIGDILDFTELDMGKLAVSSERYMISSLVNDVIAEYSPRDLGECELVFEVDTSIPSDLVGDAAKIKKILHHLIDNAVKFSQKGGVYIRMSAPRRSYGVNLCIEVTDTGVGMTKGELEHIYDSFYQSDSGRTRMAGGLGLGLTIVHGMVAEMKGFITIDSEQGAGTTVHVSIPQGVADPKSCMSVENRKELCIAGFFRFEKYDVPRVREFYSQLIANTTLGLGVSVHLARNTEDLDELRRTYGLTHIFVGEEEFLSAADYLELLANELTVVVVAREPFQPLPGSSIKVLHKPFSVFAVAALLSAASQESMDAWDENRPVYLPGLEALVVDDEPMNLIVAEGIFGDYGMRVTTARSGLEAIELCKARHFDVIFMDHMMPEMDGVEAMKRIRSSIGKKERETAIIALTANAVSGAREMFLAEGFDGFVAKPIEITELERVLRRVLPKSAFAAPPAEAGAEDKKQETPARAPAAQNELFRLLEGAGVRTGDGMRYCRGDEGFYRMLLGEYAQNAGEKSRQMQRSFASGDWKNYAVLVHALKSTSRMIGADELSALAEQLEAAAKKGNAETIAQHHAQLLAMSDALEDAIRAGLGGDAGEAEEEVLEFYPEGEEGGAL